jgi:hypothetical protein
MMKDILKQELAIGNMVVFNPPKYKGLLTGKIVKFTAKMIKVEYSAGWISNWVDGVKTNTDTVSVYPSDVMKVDEQLAFIHTLRT